MKGLRRAFPLRRAALLAVIPAVAGLQLAGLTPAHAGIGLPGCPSATDWPMFGHDPGRSFSSPDTCIGAVGAATLRPKWFFNTSAPVTAQPAVVGGTVYVGDFTGKFHALNAADGSERWSFDIHNCNSGHACDNDHVDYAAIDDSAAVTTIGHGTRQVVVFGGGATLFVLDAHSGSQVAALCLDRVDPSCQGGSGYTTEIESSPVVSQNGNGDFDIFTGTDVNEHSPAGPTGLYDITLSPSGTLTPKWQFDPETGVTTKGLPAVQHAPGIEHGCGDVWSSPTIVGDLIVFGTGNCDQPNLVTSTSTDKHVESTFAVHRADGTKAWQATPHAPYQCDAAGNCSGFDLDFGATANALPSTGLNSPVVGAGGKDGVYYAYNADGTLNWKTQVATASDIGGMIGSTAVGRLGSLHGNHPAVFADTAIPVSDIDPQTSLQNDLLHPNQAFGVHAIDAVTHQVAWDLPALPTYGAAVYNNGVVFVPDTVMDSLLALDADTGAILRIQPLDAPPSSPVAISGNSLYMGAGTTEAGASALTDPTALLTDPSGTAFGTLSGLGGVWGFTTTP
ncbi:MAG: PQQ-binding-like beta-propeller repeat protein [Acidimicrobiia bacterium]|nr:PQQ-binding-like beta-propeller repeat protein [Acidimicrobiia bacterium]